MTTKDISTPVTTLPVHHSTTLEQYGETSPTAVTEPSNTVTGAVQPSQLTHSAMKTFTTERFSSVTEVISWTLVAVLTVVCVGSLSINIIMVWIYKKSKGKDNNVETTMCEMEGNPCYEASSLTKTADTAGLQEAHVYKRVKQN